MEKIKTEVSYYTSRPALALLSLGLIALSFAGAGNVWIISGLGAVMCVLLLIKGGLRTDGLMLFSLLAFSIICVLSSWKSLGNPARGYASTMAIYPVMYMLLCSLEKEEARHLRSFALGWALLLAAGGIISFCAEAFKRGAMRLDFIIGNANVYGIFMVMAWFSLREREDRRRERGEEPSALSGAGAIIIPALVLSLSMGSFLAFLLGIGVYALQLSRARGFKEAFAELCRTGAALGLYAAPGLMIYAAAETGRAGLCPVFAVLPIFFFFAAERIEGFFALKGRAAVFLLLIILPLALGALYFRPTAADTFMERLEMMESGWEYFKKEPLSGVGIYQWRELDMLDGGKDFRSWHIHNAPLHAAAELGIFGALPLIIMPLHLLLRKKQRALLPMETAFFFHCFMDVSFFYFASGSMFMLSAAYPEDRPRKCKSIAVRCIAAFYLIYFAYNIIRRL